VPAGAVVLVDLAAAGRDPQEHRDPARFDPDRSGEPEHLALSGGCPDCTAARRHTPHGATIRGFRTLPVSPRP
jgi:cytochrome P450